MATIRYYEAWIGADLFGTPQAPTKPEIIRSDGRHFPTFYHVKSGAKAIVPVQIVREVPGPSPQSSHLDGFGDPKPSEDANHGTREG